MSKKMFIALTAILVIIEQWIKVVVNANHLDAFTPILEPFLYFKPMFNRDYSWINSLFQLGVGKIFHVVSVGFIILLIILVYRYIHNSGGGSKLVSTAFGFLLAGGVCSFIDKVFWDGSLDYIYVKGYFTFDLKDAYINVFIGLVIIMYIIDHQRIRSEDDDDFIKKFFKSFKKTPN